ncbi:histidine kinase [Amycolatopsis sp. NPDC048633]|uniref:sensor histidine kinase n=1 Tax=Amycolatopsis sp. NPDC048633 TaxID=3157095 RepID=UPI0033F7FA59
MTGREWGKAGRRAVRDAVGPRALPRVVARSPALRRLRAVAVTGLGLWAGFVALLTAPREAGGPLAVLVAVLVVVPALTALRSPMWAWRLLVVLVVLTPVLIPGTTRLWGWPWSPGLALTAALVLFVVATAHEQAVLFVVAAVTSLAMACWVGDVRDLALLVAMVTVVLVVGNAVRQRRVAERDSAEQHRRRAEEAARTAVLEERARIARELHDVVAHHMSVLAVRADSARYRFDALPADVATEFAELTETARSGMTEMRRLLGVLRTEDGAGPDTVPQPHATSVTGLVDRVRALGTPCDVRIRGAFDRVPAGVGLSVYRIVQEALSNAVRHAPGARIDVDVLVEAGSVRAVVRNAPGGAGAAGDGTGHGLIGMRERAAMLDGTLVTGPTADGGFEVAVQLPLGPEEDR